MHELYMQRAIQLAKEGGPSTKTNPNVGAVIVHQNRIIGEGYHKTYGSHHAEVNAVRSVALEDLKLLPESTLYVTLEPCNKHGKTPPCADLIMKHRIPVVYIACLDPSPHMSGKSADHLSKQGIDIHLGLLEKEASRLLRPFKKHQAKKPFVTLKIAKSKDHFMGKEGEQVWISSTLSKTLVHDLRAQHDAVLIGTQTAIVDNPSLTVRLIKGKNPARVVLDRQLRIPKSHRLYQDGEKTITYTNKSESTQKDIITINPENWNLESILSDLFERGYYKILVEPGPTLLKSFIEQELWDDAIVIEAPILLDSGIKASNIEGHLQTSFKLEEDHIKWINRIDK